MAEMVGVKEMEQVGALILRAIEAREDQVKLRSVRDDVISLASQFPLYKHRLVQ